MKLPALIIPFICLSCFTSRIALNVLEPASVDLPDEIQKISIFQVPGFTPVKNQLDSLTYIYLLPTSDAAQIKKGYIDGIYDVMAESPKFKRVILSNDSAGRLMENRVIFWDDLRKICTYDSTNYILLLQKAVTYDIPIEQSYICIYRMINVTKWVIYEPFAESVLLTLTNNDSLDLEINNRYEDSEYLLYRNCYSSGYLTGIKICPHWNETIRTYFVGPGLSMKHTSQLIKKNNWRAASLIWNDLVYGHNRSLASKAAFNMALAWEHEDDLDQALKWIQYADSLGNNKRIKMYQKIIESRLQKNKILDKQLP
jgi:hypothetical protein